MRNFARTLAAPPLAALILALAGTPAAAQVREAMTMDTAAAVLHEIMAIPEQGIPPELLGDAQAIAIIPSVIKAGFVVGGRHGRGVLLVRDPDGTWSNPVFVQITGGSFGFQAGAQATDLILVFKNRRSLESFLRDRGKFTLGADAEVAAGPIGRHLEAGTDVLLSSETYAYSRSRGLFAGLALEGAALALDRRAVMGYYGVVVSPSEILSGADVPVPPTATRLKAWLAHYTGIQPASPPVQPSAPPPTAAISGQASMRPASPAATPETTGMLPESGPSAPTSATVSGRRWRRSDVLPTADPRLVPTALPPCQVER
jgi:lipid-binding SYLF domain-containing protein